MPLKSRNGVSIGSAVRRRRRRTVIERDGLNCWRCGRLTDPDPARCYEPEGTTLDHIVATCDGGSNRVDNLRIACRRCNLERGEEQRNAAYAKRAALHRLARRGQRAKPPA